MTEQDIINYVRKCTAIILERIDQLDIHVARIELLTKKSDKDLLQANKEVERDIENRLEVLRREFHKYLSKKGY